jgi:hypothetical protein
MTVNANQKERSEAIAEFTADRIVVLPYSGEFEALLAETMDQHKFADEIEAIHYLNATGRILGMTDIGGGVKNPRALRDAIVKEFNCTTKTAMTHIKKAEMRARFPNAQFPEWGGLRPGAGRPPGAEDHAPVFEVEIVEPGDFADELSDEGGIELEFDPGPIVRDEE